MASVQMKKTQNESTCMYVKIICRFACKQPGHHSETCMQTCTGTASHPSCWSLDLEFEDFSPGKAAVFAFLCKIINQDSICQGSLGPVYENTCECQCTSNQGCMFSNKLRCHWCRSYISLVGKLDCSVDANDDKL